MKILRLKYVDKTTKVAFEEVLNQNTKVVEVVADILVKTAQDLEADDFTAHELFHVVKMPVHRRVGSARGEWVAEVHVHQSPAPVVLQCQRCRPVPNVWKPMDYAGRHSSVRSNTSRTALPMRQGLHLCS